MFKKITRLALTPLLVLGLTLNGVGMAFAAPDEELSDLQIREKLDEINSRYEVGEKFSEEDANFVKEHISSLAESSVPSSSSGNNVIQPMAHHTFSGSLGVVGGFGYVKDNLGATSGTFEGYINVQTSDLSKQSSLGVSVNVTMYGVIGTDGFGKIFDRTYSKSDTNSNYVAMNFADGYSGIAAVAYYSFRGLVNGNSFNLYQE